MTDANDNTNTPKEYTENERDIQTENSDAQEKDQNTVDENKEIGDVEKEARISTGLKWTNNKLIMSVILGILFLLSLLLIGS